MRVLSLFSGIGAFEKALKNNGHEYELVNYCEIDQYASRAYAQIHGVSESLNLKDVTKIDTAGLKDIDLITYGFPCQDISVAGRQRGFTDENGDRTRSGLFFEALRVIQGTKPRYTIAENVKALTSKKFKAEFNTVLASLDEVGYNNYYAVLNAKDYGIPQNRERVFIVSIRKDIDLKTFKFPDKIPLDLRLKDMLENNVDEKYYINSERAKSLIAQLQERYTWPKLGAINTMGNLGVGGQKGFVYDPDGIAPCLPATQYKDPCKIITVEDLNRPRVQRLGNLYNENAGGARAGNTYNPDGLAPTLLTSQGGNRQPLIVEPIIASIRGRNPDNPGDHTAGIKTEQRLEINTEGVSNTLTTVQKDNYALVVTSELRIRKLTPRECWRLMGFSDEDFNRVQGISNTQLYKMAGNSIVVQVLEAIFGNLLNGQDMENEDDNV